MTRYRFDPAKRASDNQRDLIRMYAPHHERLSDPDLSANEAWDIAGQYFECSATDARILLFFGDSPECYNQTSAARRVDTLLANSENAVRWQMHPKLDERVLDAIGLALDSVEGWGLRTHVFDRDHLVDFDVRRTFQFAAEVSAHRHLHAGVTHMGTLRKLIREEFTTELRTYRDDPTLPTKKLGLERSRDLPPVTLRDPSPHASPIAPHAPRNHVFFRSVRDWATTWLIGRRR